MLYKNSFLTLAKNILKHTSLQRGRLSEPFLSQSCMICQSPTLGESCPGQKYSDYCAGGCLLSRHTRFGKKWSFLPTSSVTRLGYLLDFEQLFKAYGNIYRHLAILVTLPTPYESISVTEKQTNPVKLFDQTDRPTQKLDRFSLVTSNLSNDSFRLLACREWRNIWG